MSALLSIAIKLNTSKQTQTGENKNTETQNKKLGRLSTLCASLFIQRNTNNLMHNCILSSPQGHQKLIYVKILDLIMIIYLQKKAIIVKDVFHL